MKKVIVILLFIFVMFLFGCASPRETETKKTVPNNTIESKTSDAQVEKKMVKLVVSGSTDMLASKLENEYEANTEVIFKTFVVTDVSLRAFLNDERIESYDYDKNYIYWKFVMPEEDSTLHLTFDQFYGKDEYTFSELNYQVRFLTDIDKVSIYTQNDKPDFSEIEYSVDENDINNLLKIFDQKLVKCDNTYINEGNLHRVIGFYKEDSLVLEVDFINEMYYWYDFSTSKLFRFEDEEYKIPSLNNVSLKTYKFEYDGLSSDIKLVSDDSFVKRFFDIATIQFVKSIEKINPADNALYYVDSRYGKIYLVGEKYFKLNDIYYEIVSGSDYWAYKQAISVLPD